MTPAKMKLLGLAAVILLAGIMVWRLVPPHAAGTVPHLTLACGAGLRPVADALIKEFTRRTGLKVDATYEGSGRLLGQLAANRRGDLFMPGSDFYVDQAEKQKLVDPETRRVLAYFIPVILVQKGNPKGVHSLRDLAEKPLRIGLGDERAVAVGRCTLELLAKNNIPLDQVRQHVVCTSGTVNELAMAIQLKTVDAVIVWDATARQVEAAGDIVPIPEEQNVIEAIPLVRIAASTQPEAARRFIEFAASETGRKIFTDHRYTVTLGSSGKTDETDQKDQTEKTE